MSNEQKLRGALNRLLASGGVIAEASDAELQRAISDPDAEEIVQEQAAAVLQARQALALPTTEPWPLRAKVWRRESTQDWVLEIDGTINDTNMNCRHTQPLSIPIEDVPMLPTLYPDEPTTQAQEPRSRLVDIDDLKDAIQSIEDHRLGVGFGSQDRKLLGRLKAALATQPQAQDHIPDAGKMAAQELPDDRDFFERAARKEGCVDFTRVGDAYANRLTLRCYRIWQARAALAAKPVPVNPQLSYAWATIEDYEKDLGFPTNDVFRMGWNMARTTNEFLKKIISG